MQPFGAELEPCPAEKETYAYICGGLSDSARARAEAHLAECPRCRQTMAVIVQTTATPESDAERALLDELLGNVIEPTQAAAASLHRTLSEADSIKRATSPDDSASTDSAQVQPANHNSAPALTTTPAAITRTTGTGEKFAAISDKLCPQQTELRHYLAGSLAETASTALESHCSDCRECRDAIAVIARALNLPEQPAETALIDRVYQDTFNRAQSLFAETIKSAQTAASSAPRENAPIPFPLDRVTKTSTPVGIDQSLKNSASLNTASLSEQRRAASPARTLFTIAAALAIAFLMVVAAWRIFSGNNGPGNDPKTAQNNPPATQLAQIEQSLSLLREVSKEARPNELRITGFDYAPYRDTRGSENVEKDRLAAAKAKLTAINLKQPTVASRHALSRAYLLADDYENAIKELEQAKQQQASSAEPKDAAVLPSILIDLAVARAAKGDTAAAIKELDEALKLAPNRAEAIFNRALLYERNNQRTEARQDWQRYLELDQNSPWSTEARRHLNE